MMESLGKVGERSGYNNAKDIMEAAARGENPGTQFIPASNLSGIRDLGVSPQSAMVPEAQQMIQSISKSPVPTKFVTPRG